MELLRVTIVWFGFFALAFVNGALREIGIKRLVDEPWAHHLSVFTGISIFTAYLFLVWERTKIDSFRAASAVGVYWVVLTFFAETVLIGRLMSRADWSTIFQAYDLRKSLWPLVLVWVGLLPAFVLWLRRN